MSGLDDYKDQVPKLPGDAQLMEELAECQVIKVRAPLHVDYTHASLSPSLPPTHTYALTAAYIASRKTINVGSSSRPVSSTRSSSCPAASTTTSATSRAA